MEIEQTGQTGPIHADAAGSHGGHNMAHDFYQRCLVILRCTALAMSNTEGGLKFKAGSQPWLDGVANRRGNKLVFQTPN